MKGLRASVEQYSRFKHTPLSLKQMLDFGASSGQEREAMLLQSAVFLRNELPIRLSHMLKEFQSIPNRYLTDSSRKVADWYLESFGELMEFDHADAMAANPEPQLVLQRFNSLLKGILTRHAPVVTTVAAGLVELKRKDPNLHKHSDLHLFLDRFFTHRISIRLLQQQHLELADGSVDPEGRHVGLIDRNCDPARIASEAAGNAQYLCHSQYAESVNFEVLTPAASVGAPIRFPYIPSHLYHICFELVKNSMRAVIEQNHDSPKPVKIVIVEGQDDLTIKISDEGGGIKRDSLPFIFSYMYTTVKDTPKIDPEAHMNNAPLAGYGYGLPLSRLYARYLQGDLNVISMEGYGTDAYVYLRRLSSQSSELLPQVVNFKQ